MTGLVTMLVSTLGGTGMGSILKIIGGVIDRWSAAAEAKEKRELARELQQRQADVEWQRAVFQEGEGASFTRTTRRILALVGMLNLFTISILCTLWPSVPLVTFVPPEQQLDITFLWGLFNIPLDSGTTVVITTGHLALTTLVVLATIVGFYFTPGGRSK